MEHTEEPVKPFEYQVTQRSSDPAVFEAWTPYRAICYTGATEKEAVSNMLAHTASLARAGSIDPSRPDKPGTRPVQHALEVLCERLKYQLLLRRDNIHVAHEEADGMRADMSWEEVLKHNEYFAQHCEVVAGLANAIAALARVKEL